MWTQFFGLHAISILDKAHACSSEMFFYIFIENAIISKFPFQINIGYTRMIDSKFEIPNKFRRGAHRAPSLDPFPALSRALPLIRALPDSDPLLLTRGCALTMHGDAILQMLMFNIRWMNTPKLCV